MKIAILIFSLFVQTIYSQVERDSYENDNTKESASLIGINSAQKHTIYPANDIDWLLFKPTDSNAQYKINLIYFSIPLHIVVQGQLENNGIYKTIIDKHCYNYGPLSSVLTPNGNETVIYFIRVEADKKGSSGAYAIQIDQMNSNGNQTVSEDNSNLSRGLVAYFPFNRNANDESGNSNNGQIYGATWQRTNGLRGLLFNGSNNYVSVPDNSVFNFGISDFTIEVRFKTIVVPTGSWAALVSKHNTANWHDREFNLSIEGGTGLPYFSLSDGTGYFETVKGITNVCDGLFHTVRGVRQSGHINIYVDGNLEGTTSASINVSNSNPINIGRSSYNNGYGYFNGVISEVSLWNRSL